MRSLTLAASVLLGLVAAPVAARDLETSYQSLQKAVADKGALQILKLAPEVVDLARQAADRKYGQDVEAYVEYALYTGAAVSAAGQTPAPALELLEQLEKLNAKSRYLDDGYTLWFVLLNKAGAAAKIPAVAERAAAAFPAHEDALLILTDRALALKQTDRAAAYAERLIAALSRHGKPETYPAADWERKKTTALARAYWTAGTIHCEKQQYVAADQDLRAALPLVQNNEAMLAPALFYLGVANYQLGKQTLNKAQVLEAARFSEKAAGIRGPLQQQAWTNAHVMKTEAAKMR